MTGSDHQPLPRDPGTMPASLRDAYILSAESRRAASPLSHPDDAAAELLLDDTADDLARLSVVDQLLGSREGLGTLAHLTAARLSTVEPSLAAVNAAQDAAAPVAKPAAANTKSTAMPRNSNRAGNAPR